METPRSGNPLASARQNASGQRAAIVGSVTIAGSPEYVSDARAFIARTLSRLPRVDSEAATLLTSELVTNAIQHTRSGTPGGTVTIVVIALSGGALVEVIDDGSAGTPAVKGDLYAADGHGLYLVQQLAAQWGYLRDSAGTTVWFHLPAAGSPRAESAGRAHTPAAAEDGRGADARFSRLDRPPPLRRGPAGRFNAPAHAGTGS